MKRILTLAVICVYVQITAQTDKSWSFGAQWGIQGNHSSFSGGMEEANAKFQHNPFKAAAFNLIARYDHNNHWMLMTGLGYNSFGYNFSLSTNYSLLKEEARNSAINIEFSSLEIPTLIHYKFEPNCNNGKWVIGAGFAHTILGKQNVSKINSESTEGSLTGNNIAGTAKTKEELSCMFRLTVARENVFKNGGILNASFVINIGLKEISECTVQYEVDQKKYEHAFVNKGSYIGFKLAYFFRPFSK